MKRSEHSAVQSKCPLWVKSRQSPRRSKFTFVCFGPITDKRGCGSVVRFVPIGHRDATLILIMTRHGLRVTEAIDLKWDQVDWPKSHLHVQRLKCGVDSVHPLQGDELRALRRLRKEQTPASGFMLASERGGPMQTHHAAPRVHPARVTLADLPLFYELGLAQYI